MCIALLLVKDIHPHDADGNCVAGNDTSISELPPGVAALGEIYAVSMSCIETGARHDTVAVLDCMRVEASTGSE